MRVSSQTEEPQTYARPTSLASNLDQSQVIVVPAPESVPFWDLDETIVRTERSGLDATRYKLQYEVLLGATIAVVAMVFVALPFNSDSFALVA